MKKTLFIIALTTVVSCSYAQNVFPLPSGYAGIGTSSPIDLLHVNAGTDRKGITISGDGNTGVYTDISLLINNESSVSSGKPLGWYISHRKDGYFTDTPLGQSSLEFFARLQGGNYYAPLSFKPDGNVVLVSNKSALGGNVGIGITNPTQALDVNGNINTNHNISLGNIGSTSNFNNAYYVYNAGNCYGLDLGYNLTSVRFNTRLFTPTTADIVFSSIAPNTTPATQTQFNQLLTIRGDNGNVGIGTSIPDTKLAVKGTIHAQEVKVDMIAMPDYVFEPSYNLPSLKEIKTYIDQNHHLPEVPSAQQVAKEGLNLGEMNATLLKKVEELTLYLIEKDKQVNDQNSKIADQQKEIEQLKQEQGARIATLEKAIFNSNRNK